MRPLVADVREAAQLYFTMTKDELTRPGRSRFYARRRQIAMTVARQMSGASLPQIGRHFGGRDHTTVMHAVRRINTLIPDNLTISNALDGVALLAARICTERHAKLIESAAQLLAIYSVQAGG